MHAFKNFGVVVLTLSLATLAVGCKKENPPQQSTVTSAPAPTALNRAVGDRVDVQWNGSWWKGKILAVQDTKYKVHYIGWSSSWDEAVAPERVRDSTLEAKTGTAGDEDAPAPAATPSATVVKAATPAASGAKVATSAFAVGSKVDVNWKGTWFQAKILSKTDATYRVHYIGWASSWDDSVTPDKVRPFSGSASKGSTPE